MQIQTINDPEVIRWFAERPEVEENGERRPMRVAVVGLSDNPARPSYRVALQLQQKGYKIIPVTPKGPEILGEKVYGSLQEIPFPVDVVDVFRAPEHVLAVVADMKGMAVKPRLLWLQEGVVHEAAAQEALDSGVAVVMNRCTWKEVAWRQR
jgi:predicted CoA-binding protein